MDGSRRDSSECSGAAQNLLSSVFPLDWLFSAGEPEPPNSPKRVSTHAKDGGGDGNKHNESGSSGTDTETRTLLPQRNEEEKEGEAERKEEEEAEEEQQEHHQSRGAIPKKHPSLAASGSEEGGGGSEEEETGDNRRRLRDWQRRALRRRQQNREETEEEEQQQLQELQQDDDYQVPLDLRERIMEILSSPTSEECDRELSKLKQVLEKRKRRRNQDGSPSHLTPWGESQGAGGGRGSGSSSQQLSLRGSPRRSRRTAHWSETPGTDGEKLFFFARNLTLI